MLIRGQPSFHCQWSIFLAPKITDTFTENMFERHEKCSFVNGKHHIYLKKENAVQYL